MNANSTAVIARVVEPGRRLSATLLYPAWSAGLRAIYKMEWRICWSPLWRLTAADHRGPRAISNQ